MAEVVCLGELLIDFVPAGAGDDPARSDTYRRAAGGAPANVAAGLARVGTTSAFMGQVGDDMFGRFLAAALKADGVDVSPLRFTRAARTMLAFVSIAANGEREFLFYRDSSADMLFAPADVDEAAIRAARILHFGSISLIAEPSRAATLHAIRIAREHGLRLSYDPNLRLDLWRDADAARAGLMLGLSHAQIVKVGLEEASFLTGIDDPLRAARSLWHADMMAMVVTMRAGGCLWLTRDDHGVVPGFAVTPVDTTGAGDAFTAGLLSGTLETNDPSVHGNRLPAICRRANAMGALTTTRLGAIPALPDRATLQAFLDSNV
jgi:fructokinase